MAFTPLTPLNPIKFQLFVPGKNNSKQVQPAYGTDMRVIENGTNLFINKIVTEFNQAIAEINLALEDINLIITIGIPKFIFGNVAVGTNPPPDTQITDFSTTVTVTTDALGQCAIPLSGFVHGYNALVTANWPGLMPSVNLPNCTLTNLELNFQETTGPFTGTISVTVRLTGA